MSLSAVGGTLSTVSGTIVGLGVELPVASHLWKATSANGEGVPDQGAIGTADLVLEGATLNTSRVFIPGDGASEICSGVPGTATVTLGLSPFTLVSVVEVLEPGTFYYFGVYGFFPYYEAGKAHFSAWSLESSPLNAIPATGKHAYFATRSATDDVRSGVVGVGDEDLQYSSPMDFGSTTGDHAVYFGYGSADHYWYGAALFIGTVLTDDEINAVAADLGL